MISREKNPDYLNSFLDYMVTIQNKSPNTVKEYNYDLATFLKFIKMHFHLTDETELDKIDYEDVSLDTIKKMDSKKLRYVPILKDNKLIGIFSDKNIGQMLIKNNKCEKTFNKIENLLKIPANVKFVKTEDMIDKTLNLIKNGYTFIICTDNGKSTGNIEGIITEEEIKNLNK